MTPAPLVPPEVDLRGLEYMPLFGNHLFGSAFNARATDPEWRTGVTLWWAAWNQVPAASLPDDDIALARLADFGRDVRRWKRIKERALYGFVRCSDGRLYHRFLATQALIAWAKRVRERDKKRRWREAQDRGGDRDKAAAGPGQDRDGDRDNATAEPGQNRDKGGDGTADVTGRDVTGRKPLNPLSGEKPPDDALEERKGGKAQAAAKAAARAAAERAIAYLNLKAGTRFQAVEANAKLPAARILYDGASESDLLAVVNLKVAEAERGDFDRKYLRPATLWNAEKFAQYVGQVNARPPTKPQQTMAKAYLEMRDGALCFMADYPAGEPLQVARTFAREYRSRLRGNVKNVMVEVGASRVRFSVRELAAQ